MVLLMHTHSSTHTHVHSVPNGTADFVFAPRATLSPQLHSLPRISAPPATETHSVRRSADLSVRLPARDLLTYRQETMQTHWGAANITAVELQLTGCRSFQETHTHTHTKSPGPSINMQYCVRINAVKRQNICHVGSGTTSEEELPL